MFGQGGAELFQGQVGAHHGMVAAAQGQRGADVVGREKDVGFCGDLGAVAAGAGKPGATTWVVGVGGVFVTTDEGQVLIEKQRLGMSLTAGVSLDAPHLVSRCFRGVEQRFQLRGAQRANHEKITVAIAQIQGCQIRVIPQRLTEGFEQRQALLKVGTLHGGVEHQQAEQMSNRLVGRLQIQADILLDAIEELFAAGKNDLRGLTVIENAQHHPGQQQQQGEHHTDMNVQGKPPLIRAQWVGHAVHSMMVNALLSVQA